MSTYNVNSANTNQTISFRIEPADAADRNAAIFGILNGPNTQHPFYGKLDASTATVNQKLAQLRTDKVVRALTAYAPVVGVKLANDSASTGVSANFGSAIIVTFETAQTGIFGDVAFIQNNGVGARDTVADLADVLGTGGMNSPKTKKGLQSLLDTLSTLSYDNGVTGPFGTLSTSGNIVLPDTTTTAGAPVLTDVARPAGLVITLVA